MGELVNHTNRLQKALLDMFRFDASRCSTIKSLSQLKRVRPFRICFTIYAWIYNGLRTHTKSARRHLHSINTLHHAFIAYYIIFPPRPTPSASSAHKKAQLWYPPAAGCPQSGCPSRGAHTNSARMWQ